MSTRELFGDFSSDDDITKHQAQPPTLKDTSPAGIDSDDDDEGDAEFDDQGAVVGLASTTTPSSSNARSTKSTTTAPMDVDQKQQGTNTQQGDDSSADDESLRTMVVQELDDSHRPKEQELYMIKLPNFMGIQPSAFDPKTYDSQTEEQDFGPQSAFNLARWRYGSTNTGILESNTRLVQWDNGSWTLHVGSEGFEVDLVDSSDKKTGFAGLNGYLYMSQKATFRGDNNDSGATTNNPAGTVLECLGNFRSRMSVRPSSLQSDAHKSLTVAIRSKTTKRARIAEFTTTEDPEKLKEMRIKLKADLEKAAMRKQQGGYNNNASSSYKDGGSGGPRRPRMSRSYLEEQEEDRHFDTTNIRAMKKGMYDKDMDDFGDEYDNDEEDDDETTFHRVRPKGGNSKPTTGRSKTGGDDGDSDGGAFGGDDSDEDDVAPVVKANKKRAAQSMFDDDSD
jgi:RNA polymerase-associated protein LEO1